MNRPRGFALVELLVALVVGAIVLLAAGSAYRGLLGAAARAERTEEETVLAARLCRRIQTALAATLPGESFRGTPASAEFTTLAFRDGRPVRVRIEEGAGGLRYAEAAPPEAPLRFHEVPGVRGLSFFFRDETGSDRTEWSDSVPPRAVRFSFEAGGRRYGSIAVVEATIPKDAARNDAREAAR